MLFTPSKKRPGNRHAEESFQIEKLAIFASLFLFAFGMGLITNGKKVYSNQVKISQRVDFKNTLNPYQ